MRLNRFILSMLIVSSVPGALSHAQTFKNLDFSEVCDSPSTGLCSWDRSWGGPGSCAPDVIEGNRHLRIHGGTASSVGFAEQSVLLDPIQSLHVLTVTMRVRTEKVVGKGAGINIGMYDGEGKLLFTRDMGYAAFNWISGTTGWKQYSLSAVVPVGVTTMKVGAILYGQGIARFDDVRVDFTSVEQRTPSDMAVSYIAAATTIIAKHSLRKDSVDLASYHAAALQIAGPAASPAECHLAIEYLLKSIGDNHSFFMTPKEVHQWSNDTTLDAGIAFPTSRKVGGIGYIVVPPFHGGNQNIMVRYADSLQQILKWLDREGVDGWIVDLRENTGGNMAPMIAGLGPLFDADKLGSLVDVNGDKESWLYALGSYRWETETIITVPSPVTLSRRLPIAVLIGPHTGSSGEIVAISFKKNFQTKFFGHPTWGLTTGNGSFDLPDGARMMLASTRMADREGTIYYGSVQPDEQVISDSSPETDEVLDSAVRWIQRVGSSSEK